jgi:uncharacterized protein (UPF0333 family)
MLLRRKGQSTLEYALIIAVVVAALLVVQIYMRRSVRGRLRSSSDQIGDQYGVNTYSRGVMTIGGRATGGGTTTTQETRTDTKGGILSNITAGETIESQMNDTWSGGS